MSGDDPLLARFTARRDEASFRELYRCHTPYLYGLAMRLAGDPAAAEELTQEAWVRALERHDRYTGGSAYRTWLAGILVNCFREARRHEARAPDSLERDPPAPTGVVTPFPATARRPVAAVDVERALLRLPPGYREVVLLHDLYGLTHAEIGDLLNIRPGTSKSQLMRGRARLRDLLSAPAASDADGRTPERRGTP